MPYGTSGVEALTLLPKTIKLNVKGGTTITTTATDWKWADSVQYDPVDINKTYTANGTFTVPSGYTYNGTLTATAKVTVLPLDREKLVAAIQDAEAVWSQKLTDDEWEAAQDNTKIWITDKAADAVTEGVRFTTSEAKTNLETAISKAQTAEKTDFESQKACDEAAKALRDAITAFNGTIKTGENTTTDAYILQQVKENLLNPDRGDYAYSSHMQPLKPGYAYWLYNGYYSVPNSSVGVSIEWSVSGSDKVTIGNTDESDKDSNGYHYGYGAKIADGTTTPTPVTFTAKVKNSQNDHVIGTLDYSATIGAPISATLPSGAPQFTATNDDINATNAQKFTGVVQITLNGADAIASVSSDCVTMASESKASDTNKVSLYTINVDKVEKSDTVLNVTVSVTTGSIGGVWNENSLVPKSSDGKLLNISIDTSKLQLKENTLGWYLPTDTLKLNDMTVEVLTPAFTGVYPAVDPTTGNPTFTIHTQNMPENAKVEVALAKTSVNAADIEKATIKATATRGNDGDYSVTCDKNEFESNAEYYLWFRYGAPGSDWAYENVTNRPTYTFNNTTGSESEGGGDASGSTSGGNESGGEGSQAGA